MSLHFPQPNLDRRLRLRKSKTAHREEQYRHIGPRNAGSYLANAPARTHIRACSGKKGLVRSLQSSNAPSFPIHLLPHWGSPQLPVGLIRCLRRYLGNQVQIDRGISVRCSLRIPLELRSLTTLLSYQPFSKSAPYKRTNIACVSDSGKTPTCIIYSQFQSVARCKFQYMYVRWKACDDAMQQYNERFPSKRCIFRSPYLLITTHVLDFLRR